MLAAPPDGGRLKEGWMEGRRDIGAGREPQKGSQAGMGNGRERESQRARERESRVKG
jgi:hypothetical protein